MIKPFVFEDTAATCKAVAAFIAETAQHAIHTNGKFSIALSGGNTPKKLYEYMSEPTFAALMPWDKTYVFWSDERCVPFSDEQNNSHMAFEAMLNKVPVPPANIFPIPVELSAQEAASEYERKIKIFFGDQFPVFDIILLGLGDNGHTASLFPHTSILNEKIRLVKEVFVPELNTYRISFTVPLINKAAKIVFFVTGKSKATIINTIFTGETNPNEYPAQLIRKEKTYWFIDKAANSQL